MVLFIVPWTARCESLEGTRWHKRLSWYYVVRATTCPALRATTCPALRATTCPALPKYMCGGRSRACLIAIHCPQPNMILLLYKHVLNVDPEMHVGRSWEYRKGVPWTRNYRGGKNGSRPRGSALQGHHSKKRYPRSSWFAMVANHVHTLRKSKMSSTCSTMSLSTVATVLLVEWQWTLQSTSIWCSKMEGISRTHFWNAIGSRSSTTHL